MSWRPEVIADSSGQWTPNGLRFATKEEAEQNALDLAMRWTAVRETRATESSDPVNYTYIDGKLEAVVDTSDIPEASEEWFAKAKLVKP